MATEQVVEQVAEGLEDAAQATRQLNVDFLGGFGGGLIVGFAIGFYFGHRWNKEKIRAEEIRRNRAEVDQIRDFYQEKHRIDQEKPSLDEVVEEKGYSAIVEESKRMEEERLLKPPVPVQYPKPRPDDKSKNEGWDYTDEISQRSENHPYIIHQDEYNADHPGYQQLTWTYYAADDILADEHDEIVTRPELIVGSENLKKFGHGADDHNVVFIRNEKVQMEFEVCRVLKSYVEEVQGLDLDNPVVDDDDDEA